MRDRSVVDGVWAAVTFPSHFSTARTSEECKRVARRFASQEEHATSKQVACGVSVGSRVLLKCGIKLCGIVCTLALRARPRTGAHSKHARGALL